MLALWNHMNAFVASKLPQLQRNERGVTIVEYAIMLALVAIAVALATPGIRDAIIAVFQQAIDAMTQVGGG